MDEFQTTALDSVALTAKDLAALAHRTLGLTGEAGILANTVKKVVRDKAGIADTNDLVEIEKRLGDVLYYIATLSEYFDLKLSDVAAKNLLQSSRFKQSRQPGSDH